MSAGGAAPDWWSLPPHALAEYFGAQRWSGARGAAIADVAVEAVVPVPLADAPPCAVLVVRGRVGDARVRWQLPLAEGMPPRDATALPAFRDAVREAVVAGRALDGTAADGSPVRWRARSVGADARLDAALPSRVGSAEQSNTSILYGDAAILKLFRRLEAGPQPDVEIGDALARAGFAHVPALLGVIELQAGDERTVLGMAQAMVPGAEDAWAWLVSRATTAVAGDARAWDASVAEAGRLGATARALRDALAAVPDPDFAAQPAT
ncbi:hypothetical protein PYV61_17010, partial [Roseisolibacter sp. H3M3-2]|nr:hypothetical protein [Roseisolibacter sp. H3M3-2]